MRSVALGAALVLAVLAGVGATWTTARADEASGLVVSPRTVAIGLDFAGADVTISGTTPEGADVVLVVDGPVHSVEMQKKGKVMGLLWMTVEQAEVGNVPSFHVVHSSEQVDRLLSRDEQIQLGVDPASTYIISEARAVDTNDGSPLPEAKAAEFVSALRDGYMEDDGYAPCPSYRSIAADGQEAFTDAMPATGGVIHLEEGRWETSVSLPSDAPLGEYSVKAHYVRDGQVVGSDAATFSVEKVGVVDSLGNMAEDNAALYGAMSLAIAIAIGLTIGFVFPRRGGY